MGRVRVVANDVEAAFDVVRVAEYVCVDSVIRIHGVTASWRDDSCWLVVEGICTCGAGGSGRGGGT